MTNRIPLATQSKHDARVIAQTWLNRGILPVPLYDKTKKPIGDNWNKYRATLETIPGKFEISNNVGGLWGDPSGGIVDVDLDWDEAIIVAARLLPRTFVYGRGNRPRSHYLFKSEGAKSGKWIAPPPDTQAKKDIADGIAVASDGSNIVELRSTGAQTVLPGSIHPEGDRYSIDDDCAYCTISPKKLERLLNNIAAASLLARKYPESGARHDFVHSLAGALLNLSWADDKVTDFVWAVLDAAEGETDRAQRERTLTNTIRSFHEGGKVFGFKTLSNWLSPGERDRLTRWLERDARYKIDFSTPPPEQVTREPDRSELVIQPRLLEIPGLVGEIMHWAGRRSFVKQPLFDLATGIVSVAMLSGNRYLVDIWDTPLQPYVMILAPTACGKESALSSVAEFCRRVELSDTVFQGFQSYHAMLDQLLKPPNMACWLWDEAGRKLRQAGRSMASPEAQVVTWLLSLYGRASSYSAAFPGRNHTIPKIDFPFLCTLAASQPGIMVDAISSSDLSTGLINRFILIDAGDHAPDDNYQRQDIFPSRLMEMAKKFKEVEVEDNTFLKIPFAGTQAYNMFKEFQTESRKRASQEGSNEMWGRACQNALILAGIMAVGVDCKKPVIEESTATWAIELSRWSFIRWNERLGQLGTRSRVEESSRQVERIINSARSFTDRFKNRANILTLLHSGLMPRSVLTRLCRNLTARELDEVLKTLIEAELIVAGEKNDCEVYWPK